MILIWKKLANWFYSQGKKHANMKSVRGSYEAPVPKKFRHVASLH